MRIDLNKDDVKSLRSFFDESHNHYLRLVLRKSLRSKQVLSKLKPLLPVIAQIDNYGTIHDKYQDLITLIHQ